MIWISPLSPWTTYHGLPKCVFNLCQENPIQIMLGASTVFDFLGSSPLNILVPNALMLAFLSVHYIYLSIKLICMLELSKVCTIPFIYLQRSVYLNGRDRKRRERKRGNERERDRERILIHSYMVVRNRAWPS